MRKNPNIDEILNTYIGLFFKYHRKNLRMSGKTLSKKINISQQQISRYENGKSVVNLTTAINLCYHLDIDILEFSAFIDSLKKIINKDP